MNADLFNMLFSKCLHIYLMVLNMHDTDDMYSDLMY